MSLKFLGFFGFLLTSIGFTALVVLLAIRRPSTFLGRTFLAVNVVQALWAWAMTLAFTRYAPPPLVFATLEATRTFSWTGLLVALMQARTAPSNNGISNAKKPFSMSRTAIACATLTAVTGISIDLLGQADQTTFILKTIASVIGLVCLEQTVRATPGDQRWPIKMLMIALGGLFAFDLVMYSEALMFSRLNFQWWAARGYANALLVPLIAITAVRNRDWNIKLGVSRNLVFHSSALLFTGMYLVVASLAGYYVRFVGGNWGEVAQAVVIFAALVCLLLVALSGSIRATLKVFLAKNFFNYRFDYREEWLRLTDTLHASKPEEVQRSFSPEKLISAMGRIVDSTGGALWLRKDSHFEFIIATGSEGLKLDFGLDEPFLDFMARKDWIIDLDEYRKDRSAYESIPIPNDLLAASSLWILMPLTNTGRLEGVLALNRPMTTASLNWEVRDILKVAARQLASLISLQNAVESLVQARQFDSFNKMSAFVVHDLKNLVSQLSLLVKNASTHSKDPEFQKDMMETVENVLQRMQGLLMQLRLGTKPIEKPQAVSVGDLMQSAVASKKGLHPKPSVLIATEVAKAKVLGHPDRLERVIGHLIQNACEASTGQTAKVEVCAEGNEQRVYILVKDNGQGMSENFIKNQLFKPFISTKAHGMGIGTFESREYLREIGGTLSVTSKENQGTTFKIELATAPL